MPIFSQIGEVKVPLDEDLLDCALLELILCPVNKPGKEAKSLINAAHVLYIDGKKMDYICRQQS